MIAPVVLPRFEFDAARALKILAMLKSALVSAARHDIVVHSGIQNAVFRLAFCGGHFDSRSLVCGLHVPTRVVIAANRILLHMLVSMDPKHCTSILRRLGFLRQESGINNPSTVTDLDLSPPTIESSGRNSVVEDDAEDDADRTRPESAAEFFIWSLGQTLCTWVPPNSYAKGGIESGGIDGPAETDRQSLARERALLIQRLCEDESSSWREQLMSLFCFALDKVPEFITRSKQYRNILEQEH